MRILFYYVTFNKKYWRTKQATGKIADSCIVVTMLMVYLALWLLNDQYATLKNVVLHKFIFPRKRCAHAGNILQFSVKWIVSVIVLFYEEKRICNWLIIYFHVRRSEISVEGIIFVNAMEVIFKGGELYRGFKNRFFSVF